MRKQGRIVTICHDPLTCIETCIEAMEMGEERDDLIKQREIIKWVRDGEKALASCKSQGGETLETSDVEERK